MPVYIFQYNEAGNLVNISGTMLYIRENLSSQVNGTNTVFMTSRMFVVESLEVFLNGQMLVENDDYTIVDSNTFQFISAPQIGDKVIVRFIPA